MVDDMGKPEGSGCPFIEKEYERHNNGRRHEQTIIEKLGGPEAAAGILVPSVEIFYRKLLEDDRISFYFEGVDTEHLKRKQVEFLAYVFGGPEAYAGKDIAEAHKKLIEEKGLNEIHFDIVAGHLADTMRELRLSEELVSEATEVLMTARPVFERPRKEADEVDEIKKKIEELIMEQEEMMKHIRKDLRALVKDKGSKSTSKMKSALKMRGTGLAEFLDETLQIDD